VVLRPYVFSPLMPDGVVLDNVSKRYGAIVAVDHVSLEVARGQFVSLLGPSGCGKTTLLRLIGGFEAPDAGRVHIAGRDVTKAPPQQRPTAMVFQSYALFPNLSVGENVAYGLRVQRRPQREIGERVAGALRRVGLAGFEDRTVGVLSGGQQQRVALARSLAVEPAVLLFDEPLSNLDLALREETRRELKALQRELGTTSIYVTHDQQEALALSDHVVVLDAGRVVEQGPPERLYEEPETAFAAAFLGGSNLVPNRALAERLVATTHPGEEYVLAVRPTSLRVATEDQPGAVPARMRARQFLGPYSEWALEVDGPDGPVPLRLWTSPSSEVPARLFVRAAAYRWVRR
jgi:ABC-type Fe3+/spermidine/putrescine transport system ATPase subunit